jgi:hypothetical protein
MKHDRSGLRVLDRRECAENLAGTHMASIAVTVNALPVVLPVIVVGLDDMLYVRAAPDGVLARCMPNYVVSLLVWDDVSLDGGMGWTISVTGVATPVTRPTELDACLTQLPTWTDRDVFLRVPTTIVSGREFAPQPRSQNARRSERRPLV